VDEAQVGFLEVFDIIEDEVDDILDHVYDCEVVVVEVVQHGDLLIECTADVFF
jgi:hypothetical protein